MLFRAYIPPIITALFGGLFIAAGIYTFGNALLFDRIFIGVLIFTGLVCYKNINVVGALLIILAERGIEEFAWLYVTDHIYFKLIIYPFCIWFGYYLKHDWIGKLLISFSILVAACEVMWFFTDYSSPQIYWYVLMIALGLFARYIVFSRVSYTERYFPGKAQSINLDWAYYRLIALSTTFQAIVCFEFLIRHLFDLPNLLIFYKLSPYVMHLLSTLLIWATFNENSKLLLPRLLKA